MPGSTKRNVIGILVDAIDYKTAEDFIFQAAYTRRGAAISALAVRGVMTGVLDAMQALRVSEFATNGSVPVREQLYG